MNAKRETRAEGNGAVNINLDLAYRLKDGEEGLFLEPYEVEEIKERIRGSVSLMPQGTAKEDIIAAMKRIQDEAIATLGPFGKRISAFLLRAAVQGRYRNREGKIEVPRRAAENTKPGVWWGELQVQLEDFPASIEVSPAVAQWIVTTWFDDKVQNGLDDKVQAWANVYEAEMERDKVALESK
jgi:hypothetical protein